MRSEATAVLTPPRTSPAGASGSATALRGPRGAAPRAANRREKPAAGERSAHAIPILGGAELSLLGRLSASEITDLETLSRRRTYLAGAIIFSRGDPGDAVHIVTSGRVRLVASDSNGHEATVGLVHPGGTFGEHAALTGRGQSLTALACEATTTAVVAREPFLHWLLDRPGTMLVLLELLSLRLDRMTDAMGDLLVLDSPQRLAKLLVTMARARRRGQANDEVRIPLTQSELGAQLGVSRESVNKALRMFASEGWVSTARRVIVITNEPALHAFADAGKGP